MTSLAAWLTYAEAAKVLKIKPASVKRRAIQRKWPRQIGNDGQARIQLPDSAVPSSNKKITSDDISAITGDAITQARDEDRLQQLTAELADARAELAGTRAEAAGLRDRLSDAHAERDRLAALLNTALQPHPGLIERLRAAFTRDNSGRRTTP